MRPSLEQQVSLAAGPPAACPGAPRALPPLSREGASFQEMAAAFRSWDRISSLFLRTGRMNEQSGVKARLGERKRVLRKLQY